MDVNEARHDAANMISNRHGHDIKLSSLKASVVLKSMIILQNLVTTIHRKIDKSEDGLKLTKVGFVTVRVR
jgi:hypothetical protein